MLTRQQMVDTINAGGSVLFKGRLITRLENLPSAAALAKTPEEKKTASKEIDAQIATLRQQKSELDKAPENTGGESGQTSGSGESGSQGGQTAESEAAEKAKAEAEAKAQAEKEAAEKAKGQQPK